jgi:hypothetical protein
LGIILRKLKILMEENRVIIYYV